MKRIQALFTTLIISGLFILSSCASLNSPQSEFPDDVYGRAATAKPLPEHVYVPNENQADGYYDESYVDGYEDGYYASRLNRFYYFTPGMSYYDPFFDPWMGYSPYGYGRLSFGFGFGWGSSWYNPYYGSYYGGWGYPYNSWGPYSYYDRFGYGYGGRYGYGYGYGYYPGVVITKPIRTRPSNLGTDNIGNRSTRPSRGVVSSANGDRNVRPGTTRPATSVRPSRDGSQTVRPGSSTRPTQTTRPSRRNEGVRPGSSTRPTQQPQTRPAQQTRPTQTTRPTRTERTRPANNIPISRPTPSYNTGGSGSSSSGSTSSGSSRSTRPSRG